MLKTGRRGVLFSLALLTVLAAAGFLFEAWPFWSFEGEKQTFPDSVRAKNIFSESGRWMSGAFKKIGQSVGSVENKLQMQYRTPVQETAAQDEVSAPELIYETPEERWADSGYVPEESYSSAGQAGTDDNQGDGGGYQEWQDGDGTIWNGGNLGEDDYHWGEIGW